MLLDARADSGNGCLSPLKHFVVLVERFRPRGHHRFAPRRLFHSFRKLGRRRSGENYRFDIGVRQTACVEGADRPEHFRRETASSGKGASPACL